MNTPRRILWTGGFDSTALVIRELEAGAHVEPHYIRFGESWQKQRRETDARDRIRQELPADLRARLAPDVEIPFRELDVRTLAIDRALYQVKRWTLSPLEAADYSPQVASLAAAGELIAGLVAGYVATDAAIRDRFQRDVLARRLELPIVHLNKRQLLEHARRGGFGHVLALTWSCEGEDYEATGQPCGVCLPCGARIIPAVVRHT